MEILIEKLTYGPDAIGRLDGITVFVPGVVPGDLVDVEIIKKSRNFYRAGVKKIIKRSKEWVKPPCPVFGRCGGCQWQNLAYSDQLAWKFRIVTETLSHLAGVENCRVSPVVGCKNPFGYRNKIQQPLGFVRGKVISGYYERGSHKLVSVENCLLELETGNKIMNAVRKAAGRLKLSVYDETARRGLLRHAVVRVNKTDNTALLTLVSSENFKEVSELARLLMEEARELKGVVLNVNRRRDNVILGGEYHTVKGDGFLTEKVCGLKFMVSSGSFFQTNTVQAEELIRTVQALAGLTGSEDVLDLYSGIGLFGLCLAGSAGSVTFVEENPQAVTDALKNSTLNKLSNVKFYEGRVEEVLKNADMKKKADVVIVDPPRQGLHPGVIEWIRDSTARAVVYVSCDLGTLCRDIKLFRAAGFEAEAMIPVDLFPQTFHIETLTRLTRRQ